LPQLHRGAALLAAEQKLLGDPAAECGPLGSTHLCEDIMQECNAYFPLNFAGAAGATVAPAINTQNYLSFTPLYLISLDAAGNDTIDSIEISGTDYLDGPIANDLFTGVARDPLPYPAANMPKGGIKFTQAVPVIMTVTFIGAVVAASYVAIGIAER
jgi:hypothetical protein